MDNRVRYTKAVLQQALLNILKNKSIDKVTIKELCEEAQVNRGTFYLHYSTPNDLLMEIEQQFVTESMTMFKPYFHNGYEIDYMAELFSGILRNPDVCRIIMGKNGNPRFLDRMKELVHPVIVDGWCKEFPRYQRKDLDYVFDFIFAGSMELILGWIDDDKCLSTQELANRLDRLGHYCHLAISEFRKQ